MLLKACLRSAVIPPSFQWAPTLGGECYKLNGTWHNYSGYATKFQWAPTLGGECYFFRTATATQSSQRFNGHPPLGVNATEGQYDAKETACQKHSFNGHPPLGVNATVGIPFIGVAREAVSMGTHPWG